MTVEKSSPEELLSQFRERYSAILAESEQMKKKLQENEAVALKLLGAIETLSYLNDEPVAEETTEETVEETTEE